MGRNASDFTSTGIAPVGNGNAVAKYIGLPRIRSSGAFTYGKIGSSGCLVHPASPASANDAPMTLRNPRRLTASTHSFASPPACRGNSSASISWKPGVSANSSRLFQYRLPLWPSSLARTWASVNFAGAIAVTTCAVACSGFLSVSRVVFIGGMSRSW